MPEKPVYTPAETAVRATFLGGVDLVVEEMAVRMAESGTVDEHSYYIDGVKDGAKRMAEVAADAIILQARKAGRVPGERVETPVPKDAMPFTRALSDWIDAHPDAAPEDWLAEQHRLLDALAAVGVEEPEAPGLCTLNLGGRRCQKPADHDGACRFGKPSIPWKFTAK